MSAQTYLVRVPVEDLDDTYVGVRVLICGVSVENVPLTVCGGIGDLLVSDDRACALVWINGTCVVLSEPDVVVAEAPHH